jgi:histidinol-phosphate/aromatic aminotransferase/cobyric acid decarboxylase-like protein
MTTRLELEPQISAACLHGGAFWAAIGDRFDRLDASQQIVSADVLDAWFPPAPAVIDALRAHLDFLIRTSPPTGSEGMIREIARARGVEPDCIVPGEGSSSLIFRAFCRWLSPSSRVLPLDPSYGEYRHLAEHVLGARVDTLSLARAHLYDVDLAELADRLGDRYDLVVLVNPNSPTGRHVDDLRSHTDLEVIPGVANFVLCHLPNGGPDAEQVCDRCRASGVFLRNASTISQRLGRHAIRIAVKDRNANRRVVETLASVLERG